MRSVHSPLPAKNRKCPDRGGRDLGGELAGPVEQPDVGVGHGLAVTDDLALHHGLLGHVDAVERQPALRRAAHQASADPASSPSTTGTPTSEPYSVHEPS